MNDKKYIEWRKTFGENLKKRMYEAKYTVEDVVKMTDIPETFINDFIYGDLFCPTVRDIIKLADILGCSPYDLLSFDF